MSNNLGNKKIMAANIQRYMKIKNKKASDVYIALDIAPATFSDWIHAKTYPRIDKIEMMADYFGISKADLVEEPAEALAIKSANLIKRFEKLSDRDKQIIENLIDSMINSYTQE